MKNVASQNETKLFERKLSVAQSSLLPLMTPQEVSEVLGATVGTLSVWRTTKRYPLEYVKIGSKVMYRRDSIEAFIESRTIGSATA